jgi:glycosyltransferase involved in cell wall biosynthesis
MPRFSIVIPLYNKENFIKKTIQSALDQTIQEFEVIIIDDGSTDNSLRKVEEFNDKRIRVFKQKNKGASAARNKGVELSNHKWIAFLDADDIWYHNHLEELNNCIDNLPEAQVVSNAYEIALEKNFIKKPKYSRAVPKEMNLIDDYFSYSFIDPLFWTSSLAVNKVVFQNIGGFDEEISSGQDTDLVSRLALKYKLAYNPKVTFLHIKNTENNLSKSNHLDARLMFIKKLEKEEYDNPSLKKYLDINRFSLALQAKIRRKSKISKSLIEQIDYKNLKSKQKLLLNFPGWSLILLKKLQTTFIRLGIYKSAFN